MHLIGYALLNLVGFFFLECSVSLHRLFEVYTIVKRHTFRLSYCLSFFASDLNFSFVTRIFENVDCFYKHIKKHHTIGFNHFFKKPQFGFDSLDRVAMV